MKKRRFYSHEVVRKIEEQIPKEILEALSSQGWNFLGIYELVKKELESERIEKLREELKQSKFLGASQ